MSSSVTSCVSSLLSTELCVTMKIRHARIVARLGTASMTARRSRIIQPTSSAASAVMLATWLVTVPTGREALAGGMTAPRALALQAALVGVITLSTASTRYVTVSYPFLVLTY